MGSSLFQVCIRFWPWCSLYTLFSLILFREIIDQERQN